MGERAYLDLVREVMEKGVRREDRTGVGTLSLFGRQLRFDLRDGFPLLTTKRVFWRGVVEELLWFLSGSTDSRALSAKGVHIWDENGSREFLDSRGLAHRQEGDLGPVYGFQWRHFGAEYTTCQADYTNRGVDQISECIRQIKETPHSRRIMFCAWNPASLQDCALPPCHVLCQFYVARGRLSAQMYQRSADLGLGVPFNIASYALLVYMMAHVCQLEPGEFIHTVGDAHIYMNHLEPLREQLSRIPSAPPQLRIKRKVDSIDDFTLNDFELLNYEPQKKINMKMAV